MAIELVTPDIVSADAELDTKIHESCIALLDNTLASVRSGETDAVLIVTKSVDGV